MAPLFGWRRGGVYHMEENSEVHVAEQQYETADRTDDITSRGRVAIERPLPDTPAHARDRKDDCCFTAIRFKAIYPGDMTVTVTNGAGQTVTRRFTAAHRERTAFM